MIKQVVLLTGAIGFTLLPLLSAVLAAPAGFTPYKDDQGNVWLGGANHATVAVTIGDVDRTRNVKANACGLIVLQGTATNPLPATFSVADAPIAPATLPQQLLPKCAATGQLKEARTANFKTPDGKIVIVSPPKATAVMKWQVNLTRTIKTNACGFGKLANSTTKPFSANTTITIDSAAPVTYGSLAVESGWKCNGKTGQGSRR